MSASVGWADAACVAWLLLGAGWMNEWSQWDEWGE